MGFSCCHEIWKRRGTVLPSRWWKQKMSMSTNTFVTVVCWKESNGSPKMHTGLTIVPHMHCLFSVHAWRPTVNTQNCLPCPHAASFNRVQSDVHAFCSTFLQGKHKCGWLTKITKFSIKTDVIRPSDSTLERIMHPKNTELLWGVSPPGKGATLVVWSKL